jgi:hypothetical protein
MRQKSLIALVSLLALFLGGCPSGDGGEQAGNSTPSPSPIAPRKTPQPAATPPPFANPLTTKQPGTTTAVTGLVQTLPPETRVKQIAKGRTDPFAAIPVQPEVTVSPNPGGNRGETGRPVPPVPQLPTPLGRPRIPGGRPTGVPQAVVPRPRVVPSPGNANRPSSPARPRTLPPVATSPRLIPQLPQLPEPTEARGIEISGAAEVGGVPKAIVKVQNEPSRTVQVGDRLANGRVLVKRIEVNRGPTPVVILEQYGIEVARRVGDTPVGTSGQAGTPTPSRAPTQVNPNTQLPPPPPVPGNEGA